MHRCPMGLPSLLQLQVETMPQIRPRSADLPLVNKERWPVVVILQVDRKIDTAIVVVARVRDAVKQK